MQTNSKPIDARLAGKLVYPLRHSRVTPNHLTTLRLAFGICAAVFFGLGSYAWANAAAICFVISNFLDHADGELARLTGNMSKTGHYYDLASDAVVNILLFIGIGIGLMQGNLGGFALSMGIVAGVAVAAVFHMRLYIEDTLGKDDARQPNIGLLEAEDILYLLPLVTFFDLLKPFLIMATIGAPLFSLWVLREYLALKNSTSP